MDVELRDGESIAIDWHFEVYETVLDTLAAGTVRRHGGSMVSVVLCVCVCVCSMCCRMFCVKCVVIYRLIYDLRDQTYFDLNDHITNL